MGGPSANGAMPCDAEGRRPDGTCRSCRNLRRVEMNCGPDIWACDTGHLVEADPDDEACGGYEEV